MQPESQRRVQFQQHNVDLPDIVTPSINIPSEKTNPHYLRQNTESQSSSAQNTGHDPVKTRSGNETKHQQTADSSSRQFPDSNHKPQAEHPILTPPRPSGSPSHISSQHSVADEDCPEVFFEEPGAGASSSAECSRFVFPQPPTSKTSIKITIPTPTSGNIGDALNTLKSELTAMREQDLQLLKQLIHINDNIRRLKRARWLQRGGRTVSCGFLGVRSPGPTPHPPGGCYPGGVLGGREGGGGGGGLLTRQRSEPGLLGVPGRKVSTLTSTSSSFETIEDGDEEADSLYGSFSDLPSDNSPAPSPFSPCKPPTPSTPNTRSPSAYTSLTFTQEELWRGECSYGEILKRNIRLWKWSVAHERDTGVAGGHFCVL